MDEQIKTVVLSGKCIWCKGKIFGIAESRDEALKRLEFNLTQHQDKCFDDHARKQRAKTALYG